jgi:ribosomal protein S18 acetylase RimI-like enzyme
MTTAKWCLSDPWLSDILGKPAWRVDTAQARSERMASVVIEKMSASPCFFHAKTAVSQLADAHWLEDVGFRLVDTNITLAKPRARTLPPAATPGVEIRSARPADAAAVVHIAEHSFQWSRFHQDPAIPPAVANRSRAEWAANFFNGSRGDAMIVAATGDKPVGFLLMLGPNPDLVIDLIAVLPDRQGEGLGAAMIRFAESILPASPRIVVGTQVANMQSMVFYGKAGFAPVDASYVFHLHGQGCG